MSALDKGQGIITYFLGIVHLKNNKTMSYTASKLKTS